MIESLNKRMGATVKTSAGNMRNEIAKGGASDYQQQWYLKEENNMRRNVKYAMNQIDDAVLRTAIKSVEMMRGGGNRGLGAGVDFIVPREMA
jgi:hypothetical protein